MGILDRFTSIVKANINELLDKAEDPEKMVDQYLREMTESLAEVREATAGVMAEEKRCKKLLDENREETEKYEELARKALAAGNEADARVFLAKKQELAGRAEQGVDRNIVELRQKLQCFCIRRRLSGFPAGDGLPGHENLLGQLLL